MRELHTFAICAYKDSPYLEACIWSIIRQSCPSKVILCTSTPSAYIEGLAKKYGIPLFVRDGRSNIRDDWNFAYRMADARYVTIAHQDDYYRRHYVQTLMNCIRKYPDLTLFASDALTVKDGQPQRFEQLRIVKKLLRLGLRIPRLNHLSWVKMSALRFGNAICCPSCTYRKEPAEEFFSSDFQFVLDWDKLISLAEKPGRFICAETPLLLHRLHSDAATNACMKDSRRFREEMQIFEQLWPKPVAGVLMRYYRKAYDSYEE